MKTRHQMHQIVYKRKQALVKHEARLAGHRAHLAKMEAGDHDLPLEYVIHSLKYARYLVICTEAELENRLSDLELAKAFLKTAPFRKE